MELSRSKDRIAWSHKKVDAEKSGGKWATFKLAVGEGGPRKGLFSPGPNSQKKKTKSRRTWGTIRKGLLSEEFYPRGVVGRRM